MRMSAIRTTSSSALARAMGWKSLAPFHKTLPAHPVKADSRLSPPGPVQNDLGDYRTVANAQIAESFNRYGELPEGWSFLGAGSYRVAYLGPDNVVYKVEQSIRGTSSNDQEITLYAACSHLMPPRVRLCPIKYLTDKVVGMMLAGSEHANMPYQLQREVAKATNGYGKDKRGIYDLAARNVLYDIDPAYDYIIIDYAQ